jgi:hypothetical protein
MPFAGYADFADCVAKNQEKSNPEAYCGAIQKQAESKTVEMNGKKYKVVAENVNVKIEANIKQKEKPATYTSTAVVMK